MKESGAKKLQKDHHPPFEDFVSQFESNAFPPFDFSLFSYMKIHQRQHIRFPRPMLNESTFGNSKGLGKGQILTICHSDSHYVNYMLNELIAYVILPDVLRFIVVDKKKKEEERKQELDLGEEEFVEKQVRTDFLNQKVILLNCADCFRVHELETYLEARISGLIKSKAGIVKPTTVRKYVDYSLSNLFLIKISNILELGVSIRGLSDLIQKHAIVALVICAGVQYIDLNGFIASDVKAKGAAAAAIKRKESPSEYREENETVTKKRKTGELREKKGSEGTFTKQKEFADKVIESSISYLKTMLQPTYHFAFIMTKMERLLFKGKLFRDVIYSSFQRLDVEKGKDYAGDYLANLKENTVLVVNMSERENEQRNISIIRRNPDAVNIHEFYAVNFMINEDIEGKIFPDYEQVEQVRFTYLRS